MKNTLTNAADHQTQEFAIRSSLFFSNGALRVDFQRGGNETIPAVWQHSLFILQQDSRSALKQQSTKPIFAISSIDCTIANYFADQIFERFSKVALVAYHRDKAKVTVWTVMPELDRVLRRKIYEVQEKTILGFPEYLFDFYVVSSVSVVPDSFTVIDNPDYQA